MITIRKGDDLLNWAQAKKKNIWLERRLISATFKMELEGRKTELAITVRPPNVAIYSRGRVSATIEAWLTQRGLLSRSKHQGGRVMSQPWQALEQLNDVATSHLSWRLLLGDAFDSHCGLLLPIKDLAKALPVPNRPYEWLEIVEVEDGVFEGYNEKTRSTCQSIAATSFATSSASASWPESLLR